MSLFTDLYFNMNEDIFQAARFIRRRAKRNTPLTVPCDGCGRSLTFAEIGRGSLCNGCQARAILAAACDDMDAEPLPFTDDRGIE